MTERAALDVLFRIKLLENRAAALEILALDRLKEIYRLRAALEWYADPVLPYAITQKSEPRSAVHYDGGRRARGALGSE